MKKNFYEIARALGDSCVPEDYIDVKNVSIVSSGSNENALNQTAEAEKETEKELAATNISIVVNTDTDVKDIMNSRSERKVRKNA